MNAQQRKRRIETKDHVVCLKLAGTLVSTIDQVAEREGLTRSAIIRRVLLDRYRAPVKATVTP